MPENIKWDAVFQSIVDTWLPLFGVIAAIIVIAVVVTRGHGSKHTHSGQNPTSIRNWRRGFIFKNKRETGRMGCGGLSVLSSTLQLRF